MAFLLTRLYKPCLHALRHVSRLKKFLALLRKTATLQILLNRAEQKQRSCNIFVAVCVSARLENTDLSLSSVAATSFFNSKLIHKHEMNKN